MIRYDDKLVMSPSQVTLWLKCPELWQNSKMAISEDMRLGAYAAHVIDSYRKGYDATKPKDDNHAKIAINAKRAANVTMMTFGKPIATELKLGNCRIDEVLPPLPVKLAIVGKQPVATIIDYKYLPEEDRSSAYDHQLMHYAWAYSQYTQTWQTPSCVYEIGICSFGLNDEIIHVNTQTVDYPQLQQWLDNAIRLWQLIPRIGGAYRNTTQCYFPTHRCRLYQHCWGDHHGLTAER
jgi:hypothetical protein